MTKGTKKTNGGRSYTKQQKQQMRKMNSNTRNVTEPKIAGETNYNRLQIHAE